MLKKTPFYTLLFCLSFFCSKAQNSGVIKGKISSISGMPIEHVSVMLKGTGLGTMTNGDGFYELNGLQANSYTLEISYLGFKTTHYSVDVLENQVSIIPEIILEEHTQNLEGVVITSAAKIFAEKKSDMVARMPLQNLENSQVYTVVPKELLTEQMATDFRGALLSSPGVTNVMLGVGSGGTGLSMRMRGFAGADGAGSIRNGMATNFVSLSDPVNLERLEIIKGPSSTLFGSTLISYGGLVNRVTKQPLDHKMGEVGFSAGAYGLGRVTIDYNTPLNEEGTILFRFNSAIHREKAFQDQGMNKTLMMAPAFKYLVNKALTVNLDFEYFKSERNSTYVGLTPTAGITNFDELNWDFKRSYTSNDISSKAAVLNVFANANYKINENWTSDSRISYSNTDNDANYVFLLVKAGTGDYAGEKLLQRRIMNLPSNFNTIQFQENVIGIHNLRNNINNKFLIGLDYTQLQTTDSRTMVNDYDALKESVTVLNKPAPVINRDTYLYGLAGATRAGNFRDTQTYSAYFSDVATINKRLSLMAGLRLDHYVDNANEYKQTAWSPKFGLVYQLMQNKLSLFGNYQNGFKNVAPATLSNNTQLVFKPEQAIQLEAGVKFELLDGKINGTMSYYDIQVKDKVRSVFDSNNELTSVQDGTQESKGLEFDLIANPFRGFHVIFGYGYNDSRFTKVGENQAKLEGKRPFGTPLNSANYWVSYKVPAGSLRGFGFGLGGNYSSNYYFDDANTIEIPGFSTLDGSIFFEQAKFRVGLKLNNISNERYWTASRWAIPQQTRTFLANITFKF